MAVFERPARHREPLRRGGRAISPNSAYISAEHLEKMAMAG